MATTVLRSSAKLAPILSRAGTRRMATLPSILSDDLDLVDPEMFDIIEQEKRRQRDGLSLIASENFTSPAVLQALGSVMQNKYSEGYPAARYYGGNEFIDKAESLCQKRALETYDLDPAEWGVNVQPHSGSPANFQVYTAVLGPHGRMMALDLPHGGHLSHGYQLPTKKISAVSTYFECLPYRLDESTGYINYDQLEENSRLFYPRMIICGASAYPRHLDYERFRKIADINGSYLMTDMAHISGLVAGKTLPSPFPHSDIVTTTTHKSLRGPRGAMIFYRKGLRKVDKKGNEEYYDLEEKINTAVFPGHQGGPHNHTISALAVALKQAQTPEYRAYQGQVVRNCKAMASRLMSKGQTLVSGGTDNHLILIDVRSQGITGAHIERVLELSAIACNKNTVPGDKSALNPGGFRVGTPAMTSRGLVEADFEQVADFLVSAIELAREIRGSTKTKKEFNANLASDESQAKIAALQEQVIAFSRQFPTVGFTEESMRYQ